MLSEIPLLRLRATFHTLPLYQKKNEDSTRALIGREECLHESM